MGSLPWPETYGSECGWIEYNILPSDDIKNSGGDWGLAQLAGGLDRYPGGVLSAWSKTVVFIRTKGIRCRCLVRAREDEHPPLHSLT